jgi:hypothetical protein
VLVRRVHVAQESQASQIQLRHLLPDVITARTVNNPTQIIVNSKGQVTGLSGSEGGADQVCWIRDKGSNPYAPQSITGGVETKIRFNTASSTTWFVSAGLPDFILTPGAYELDAHVPITQTSGSSYYVIMLCGNVGPTVVATSSGVISGGDMINACLKCVFTVSAGASGYSMRIYLGANGAIGQSATGPAGILAYQETYSQVLIRRIASPA